MTEELLREIEARAAAATPGPWEGDETGIYGAYDRKLCPMFLHAFGDVDEDEEGCATRAAQTAEFIAQSREDVPAVTAPVRSTR